MPFIGIRDLSRETSRVIKEFEQTGEPVVVTREGRPIGALMPISEAQLQDLALASAPQFGAPSAAPGGSGEGGESGATRSLREAAAERGIELEQEESSEPEIEEAEIAQLPMAAAESELESITTILSPLLATKVLSAAKADIAAAYREALAAIDVKEAEQGEVREVTDATAGLYGHLFRCSFQDAIGRAEAPAAVLGASQTAGRALQKMNRSMIKVPDLTLHDYLACIRAVEVAWEQGVFRVEDEEDEEEAHPELAEPAP